MLRDVPLHCGRLEHCFFEPGNSVRWSTFHFSARRWTPSCCGAQVLEPRPCAGRRTRPVAVQDCPDTSVRRTTRNCGANPRLTHQVLTHSFPCESAWRQSPFLWTPAGWGRREPVRSRGAGGPDPFGGWGVSLASSPALRHSPRHQQEISSSCHVHVSPCRSLHLVTSTCPLAEVSK